MSAVQEWWPWYPWWDPHVQCWWWLVPNSSMPQSKVCRSSWGCRCLRGREARNPEIWREIECDLMEKNGNGFRVSPESVNSSLLPWMTINTENPESEIWLNSEGWIYGGGCKLGILHLNMVWTRVLGPLRILGSLTHKCISTHKYLQFSL